MNKLFAGLFAMVGTGILGTGCAADPAEIEEMDAEIEESEDIGEAEQALACRPYEGVTCYYSAGSSKANCYCSGPSCIWLANICSNAGGSWYQNAAGEWYCGGMQNPC